MTIKDLSAMTGYSVGTVSRVLNNHPNVSEKARRMILAAARESGFQLNANAKQLKQQRTNSILVIVRGMSNPMFAQMVEILQANMAETDHPLVVDYVDEYRNEVVRAAQLCAEKKPRGVLFLGGNREHFRQHLGRIDVPCVLVTSDASDVQLPNLSSVGSDDRQAAALAIDTLCSLGHRQIAVIGGDLENSDISARRYQGCADAFVRNGIDYDPESSYAAARYSYEGGYNAACALLERKVEFSALFAMADVMSIGAIRALQDHGLRVPEDVSVMGFDGLQIGQFTTPRLATICQDVQKIAVESIRMLTDQIARSQPPQFETVPVTVELRESVRRLL